MIQTILDKGQLRKANENESYDFRIPTGSDFLSAATNLIPGVGGVSGGRVLLGDKASIQATSLVKREAPLVLSTPSKNMPSFEEHFGKTIAAKTSPVDGKVVSVTKEEIKIEDSAGHLHTVEIYHYFNSGKKSFLHHYPKVKVGDHVKKGELLATSNFTDDQGRLALGTNLRTAIMPYRGSNFEDAFVLTESGAKKLSTEQMFTTRLEKRMGIETDKNKFISLFANKYSNAQLSKIDSDGVVKPGTKLKYGDPIILALAPKALKTTDIHLGKLSKALGNAFKDMSETWEYETEGEVIDAAKTPSLISVNVRTIRPINVGDKISIGYGNKGVTGKILSNSEAPTTADGKPVDIILNSMSITSRVSPALISTLGLGKVAEKLGKQIKITPFVEGSAVKKTEELLKKHNIEDVETLYDPVAGVNVKALVGPLFFNRLVHIAEDKLSTRSQGASYDWNMQPAKSSSDESSKRLGNLSTTALLSHGATSVLEDVATVRATKNDEFWRNIKLGLPPPPPKVPFIFDKFIASLQSSGIKVERRGDQFQILPQTDKDVEKYSFGAIKNAKTFRVKGENLIPEKGGLFDPALTGIYGTNFNHINLNQPVVNPISEDPIRRLFKLTKEKYRDQLASGELHQKLQSLNLDSKIDEYKAYLRTGKISDRDNAVKVLAFLTMLKKKGLHPKDLILTKIPVLPSQFRPVQVAGDLTLSANVNHLYKDLILNNEKIPDLKYLPEDLQKKTKLSQYDAVKAIYGLADPISVKHKEKNVKGLLSEMLGIRGGVAKGSEFQAKIVNKPLDLVGRGVATGDVKLDLDEVSVPQDIAWKVFSPFVTRRLVRKGMPSTEAVQHLRDRTGIARAALIEEMDDRPIIMSRDPALHKFNLMGLKAKINPDPKNQTVSVNPLIFKGFNLDLDGDQVSISTPAGDHAKEEVKEKMLPSKNLLNIRSFTPIYAPSNEASLGLFQLSTEDNKNKPIKFKSEKEVISAFEAGRLHPGDRVTIG